MRRKKDRITVELPEGLKKRVQDVVDKKDKQNSSPFRYTMRVFLTEAIENELKKYE